MLLIAGGIADAQFLITEISGANQSPSSQESHSVFGNLSTMKNWYLETIRKPVIETDQLDKLAKLVSRNGKFYQWALHGQESDFCKSVCLKVVDTGRLGALSTEECVFNYDRIKSTLGEDASLKFLGLFSAFEKYFPTKFLGDAVLKLSSNFIEDVYKLEDRQSYEIILKKIDDYLKGFSQEDWLDIFDKEDDRLRLLLVRKKTADITFVDPFKPALLEHTSKILEGGKTPTKYSSDWGQVFTSLKSANQKKLAEDLLNIMQKLNTTTEGCENFVQLYEGLAEVIPYAAAPDTSIDKVFSKLITSDKDGIKDFVQSKAADIKKCLKNVSDLSKNSFEETVTSLEESGSEEKISWAEELRTSLALKPSKPLKDEGDKDEAV